MASGELEPTFQSKILPYCWVCEVRFNNQVPPGPAMEERHHMVPRAYGGVDGPQVSLCDKHHTMLHKVANFMESNPANIQPLIALESKIAKDRVLWLAAVVYRSKKAFEADPNKRIPATLVMDKQEQQMMALLQKKLGVSKQQVLALALKTLFIKESK